MRVLRSSLRLLLTVLAAVPLPKSDTPSRIIENANVFDFALSDSQMARLNALDEGKKGSCSWDPVEHV